MTWIGTKRDTYEVGQIGFLVERVNPMTDWRVLTLRDHPACRAWNFEPVLEGFVGEHNNVRTYGHGVWRVVEVLDNGRAKVEEAADIKIALERLGYPELMEVTT